MGEHTYTNLIDRAVVLAGSSTDERDRRFWSDYANGLARELANIALASSSWVETSAASEEFRSAKLATIRCGRDVYVERGER